MTNTVIIGALLGIVFIVFAFGAIIPFVFIGTVVLAVAQRYFVADVASRQDGMRAST
jgi:hypothetical protein